MKSREIAKIAKIASSAYASPPRELATLPKLKNNASIHGKCVPLEPGWIVRLFLRIERPYATRACRPAHCWAQHLANILRNHGLPSQPNKPTVFAGGVKIARALGLTRRIIQRSHHDKQSALGSEMKLKSCKKTQSEIFL
jgi:hypothetical protein